MERKLKLVVSGLGLACALALGGARAADESMDSGPVRLVRNIATGSTNQVAAVAFGAGARNCSQRIDLVTNFLTRGTQSSALVFLPERDPDNNMLSVSMEVKTEGLPRAYASATFSPNTAIGCAAAVRDRAVLERVLRRGGSEDLQGRDAQRLDRQRNRDPDHRAVGAGVPDALDAIRPASASRRRC